MGEVSRVEKRQINSKLPIIREGKSVHWIFQACRSDSAYYCGVVREVEESQCSVPWLRFCTNATRIAGLIDLMSCVCTDEKKKPSIYATIK